MAGGVFTLWRLIYESLPHIEERVGWRNARHLFILSDEWLRGDVAAV